VLDQGLNFELEWSRYKAHILNHYDILVL